MAEQLKENQVRKKTPPKIFTIEEVVAKSVFEKEFTNLKKELETQQSITWQVVIGVGIAFVLAVGVIVVDTITSRDLYTNEFNDLRKEISEYSLQINNMASDINNLKIRNYLK